LTYYEHSSSTNFSTYSVISIVVLSPSISTYNIKQLPSLVADLVGDQRRNVGAHDDLYTQIEDYRVVLER
jgi:hypothetical protein